MSLFSKVSAAAIVAAAFACAPAAAAQQQPPAQPTQVEAPDSDDRGSPGINSHIIVYGAAKDPASAAIPAAPEDESVPELPVVYEDDARTAKVSAPAGAALPASPAR
jgi:hypothetical protein